MSESTALRETDTPSAADNPLAILNAAVQQGVDPGVLERLMALAENYKAQRAEEAFNAAMNACQSLMPLIVHDKQNSHTQKTYTSLEKIITTVRPIYIHNGFSLSFSEGEARNPGEVRIVCDIAHIGGCTKQRYIDLPRDGTGAKGGANMSAIQGVCSAVTYGRRYLVTSIFNIVVAGQDIDGNNPALLETITTEEAMNIEDHITDKEVDRVRFLDWCRTAGVIVGDQAEVRFISKAGLSKVIDILKRKRRPGAR